MSPTVDNTIVKQQKTAAEFDRFVERFLKDCLRAISLPLILEMYEPILPELKEEIENIHIQGEAYMLQEFKNGVNRIIEARDLIQKQNKLDNLKQEAKIKNNDKILLVPTPTQVTMGTIYKEKQAELIRLQIELDQVTEENYDLMNKIELLDKEFSDKETRAKEEVGWFNECVEIASSLPTEELIELMHKLDIKNPRM